MKNTVVSRVKRSVSRIAIAMAINAAGSSLAQADEHVIDFDIPAENAAAALNDFAKQAGVQLLFPYASAAKVNASAVKGSFTREEALAELTAGTGLEVASETADTISLRQAPAKPSAEQPVDTLTVTGSHLRNAHPASPLHVVTRQDIDQSGFSDIGEVVRALPENFSGGQNPGVFNASASNIANQNATNASTVNLRGLGSDATLVLLNGHRLAADSFFQGSDISGIPLGAVQRFEIVPDGASALYGSDAVAGVANIIMRRDVNGGEVSARMGTSSQGGGLERTYGLMQGVAGEDWHALVDIEYSKQNAVRAGQRAFTSGVTPVTTFVQPQVRKSLFLNAGREFGEHVSVTFDGMISDRFTQSQALLSPTAALTLGCAATPAYSGALTLGVNLPKDWKLNVVVVASGSRNGIVVAYPAYAYTSHTNYKNDVKYLEVTLDGTVFQLPSGPVKLALGGGRRREGFQQNLPGSSSYIPAARDVSYVYAETSVPLVQPSETRAGLHELEFSMSARTESYSDFGGSTSPKLGLRYVPADGLALRATWGKSFKAPSFLQMYSTSTVYLYKATTFGSTSWGTALLTYGGNPNLKPERSTSWTIGADYSPPLLKSVKLSATYFNIDYTDRIVQPVANRSAGLSNSLYAPFVELAPSSARQSQLIAQANNFTNFAGVAYDPSAVVAVVFDAYTNATSQAVRGVDLGYRQTFDTSWGSFNSFANATWLRLDQQTIVTAPNARLSGTIYNPPRFKARAGLGWQARELSASAVINQISSETDTGVSPVVDIAPWTTLDGTVAYRFSQATGPLHGVRLTFSASNLLDKAPPRAVSPGIAYKGLNFDSTNASVIGRFVSLTVTKGW